jgi:thiol-disulfide isomerase/thioredoxin
MKKMGLVIATVVALIIGTYFADKATRVKVKTPDVGNSVVKADSPKADLPEPELTLKDLDGKDVSLSGYKGKVVLVNFWATWCEPCRVEIPWLIEMQKKYGDKGFVILGIALDEEGKSVVAPFVAKERFDVNGQKLPMSYTILIGNDDAADKFGGLFGYPTSILISRDGKQIKRVTGMISPDEMDKAVESQL